MFKEGNKASKGRPKNSPNRSTKEVRQAFQNLISDNLEQMQLDLDSLTPKARLDVLIKLSAFVLPKLEAVSHSTGETPEVLKFMFDTDEKEIKRSYGI